MELRFEATFGRSAYAHLFVTRAMQDHLVSEWGLMCVVSIMFAAHNLIHWLSGRKAVLHDRPPSHFHRCSPTEVDDVRDLPA